MGETELSHDIFFTFSFKPSMVVEVKGHLRLNFEILTSKNLIGLKKYKTNFCVTIGSKALVYLSLLFFLQEAFVL